MIDLVFGALILVSALMGAIRGFTRIVTGTAALVLGAWSALQFGDLVAAQLSDDSPSVTQIFGGYVIAFVLTFLVVGVVGLLLRAGVDAVELNGTDRLMGFVVGVVRGIFFCSLLTLILGYTALEKETDWHHSRAVAWLQPVTEWMQARLAAWRLSHRGHLRWWQSDHRYQWSQSTLITGDPMTFRWIAPSVTVMAKEMPPCRCRDSQAQLMPYHSWLRSAIKGS